MLISLIQKMIDLIANSRHTITREDFDKQLIQHMLETHSAAVTSKTINRRVKYISASVSKAKKRHAEKEPEMIEWRRVRAEHEEKQRQERDRKEKRRTTRKNTAEDALSQPAFDVPCPIPPLSALLSIQMRCHHQLSLMELQWEQEAKERKERDKEERAADRKRQSKEKKRQELAQRRTSTNTDNSNNSSCSSTESPVKRNTFNISSNSRVYFEHLNEQRRVVDTMIEDVLKNMEQAAAATQTYRMEKLRLKAEELRLKAEELRLLQLQYEANKNIHSVQ